MAPVSVCHQVSRTGSRTPPAPQLHRLGVERLADAGDHGGVAEVVRPYDVAPRRMNMRIAVGAVYHTVTSLSFEDRVPTFGVEFGLVDTIVTPCVSGAMMP